MKLFHLADLHLGKTAYGRDLVDDQRHVLECVLAEARNEKPAAVIIAGDVFDRAVPSTDAVRLFGDFVAGLKAEDPGIVIAAIPGNHDSAARLAFLSGVLDKSGVHLKADASDCDRPVVLDDGAGTLRLWLVPFLTPGCLAYGDPPVGTAPVPDGEAGLGELFADASRAAAAPPPALRSQSTLMAEALKRIAMARAALGPGTDVLVCHVFAGGGVASDSERAFLGTAELVDSSLFDTFDYAALGHLHRPQAAGSAGRYSGSILSYSFADEDTDRGFLIVDVAPGFAEARFVPIRPLRRMVRIQGAYEQVLADPRWSVHEGDYVEALLTDAEAVLNPADALRRRFPNLLSIRQAAFERGDSEEPAQGAAGSGRKSVLEDFRDFCSEIRGSAPDEAAERIFLELLKEAGREGDQA